MDVFNTTACECHPRLPIIALGSANGILRLISFFSPPNPVVITEFHLSSFFVMAIRYGHIGGDDVMVVSDEANDIFVLKVNYFYLFTIYVSRK